MKSWENLFKWWNMGNCDIVSLDDILDHKGKSSFNKKQQSIWQAVCWLMLYLVWGARNKRVFENKVPNLSTLCDELQIVSFNWASKRVKGAITSWMDWCSDPARACKV